MGIWGMKKLLGRREEVVGRVRKLKNGKLAGIDEISGEMIKHGGERVIDWIWKLCSKAFVACIVSKDWRRAVIVPYIRVRVRKVFVGIIEELVY